MEWGRGYDGNRDGRPTETWGSNDDRKRGRLRHHSETARRGAVKFVDWIDYLSAIFAGIGWGIVVWLTAVGLLFDIGEWVRGSGFRVCGWD